MKKRISIGLAVLSISTICLLSFYSPEKPLVAHEWGTFTTLHGSDGTRLNGLNKEEEKLPSFVHDAYPYEEKLGKGHKSALNVNVKMETPVIYFYSDKKQQVEVNVKFPKGSISQWYPQRTAGEMPPDLYKENDFSKGYNGWINWKATVLAPNSRAAYSNPKNKETKTWVTPRNTKANLIQSNGDTEKFLFYRGLANFTVPIHVKFNNEKELSIENKGNDKIPFVFVYEKTNSGAICWWSGGLSSNQSQKVNLSDSSPKADFKVFKEALVNAGLYEDEAECMLATWEKSYFERAGLRVFWIVPESLVNELLPLDIKPMPAETKRVFVGRCDILTPAFEKKIVEEYKSQDIEKFQQKFGSDRYSSGYRERVKQLTR
ncbi:MAG: hypothetical protein WBP45_03990 [Daejeonella sp.]